MNFYASNRHKPKQLILIRQHDNEPVHFYYFCAFYLCNHMLHQNEYRLGSPVYLLLGLFFDLCFRNMKEVVLRNRKIITAFNVTCENSCYLMLFCYLWVHHCNDVSQEEPASSRSRLLNTIDVLELICNIDDFSWRKVSNHWFIQTSSI